MHSAAKKLALIVNNFAAITVSVSKTLKMNDFGAIDVSKIGTALIRSQRPLIGG